MGRNSGSISIPSSRVIRGWKCNFFRGFEEGNLLFAIMECFQHWIFRFKRRDVSKFAKERSNIPETLRSIFYGQLHSVEKEVFSNYNYNNLLRKLQIFHKASGKLARS